jgi:hypothetical protein
MRPRYGITPSRKMRNEILESAVRYQWKEQELEDWKKRHRIRDKQAFTYDTPFQKYNALKDEDIGGVMELGILDQKGDGDNVDKALNGSIVIGGKEHKLENGKLRIIDKKVVDKNLEHIIEQREFKDSILSAIMSDRSGRICRMMLPKKRYDMLRANDSSFRDIFDDPDQGARVSQDIISADGRPEMFMLFHESSKEFALALHKLSLVVDNTQLTFSEGIDEWTSKYNRLKSSSPRD